MIRQGTLYEASRVYEAAWQFVFEESGPDGEITQDLKAIIDAVEEDLSDKLEACCQVIAELEATAEACIAESKRLATRAKSRQENAEKLRGYIKQTMESVGLRKQKGKRFDLSIANNPASVVITDERLLPDEFIRAEIVTKILKAEISKAVKSGDFVPGAELRTSTRLVIK